MNRLFILLSCGKICFAAAKVKTFPAKSAGLVPLKNTELGLDFGPRYACWSPRQENEQDGG